MFQAKEGGVGQSSAVEAPFQHVTDRPAGL
jgi:hypothetical protein